MARFDTAGSIINRSLAELGIVPPENPFESADDAVRQMTYLLTSVGRQIVTLNDWQFLQREHVIITQNSDTGKYDLPADFDRMIDQSGWSRTQRVAVPGSVTPTIWQYLKGRNLVSSTIYAVFREVENQFWLFPQPPNALVPDGLTIAFEYMSRGWVQDGDTVGSTPAYQDFVGKSGDVVMFNPTMTERMLKLRFREARGMDATAAQNEALQLFASVSNQDVGGLRLNAADVYHPYPYLDVWRNTPDSGYGP